MNRRDPRRRMLNGENKVSHFSVLVITDKRPCEKTLKPILQPWHEYECTGVDDKYVIDVDVTDECQKEFDEPQRVVILADGSVHSRWDNRFYTKKKSADDVFGRDEFELPAGARDEEMAADEARKHGIGYKTMRQCVKEYYGGFVRNGRCFKKTNPNKKWDWWQIGGRFNGKFQPHYDPDKDPANRETCWLCVGTGKRRDMVCDNGCNGCQGTGVMTKWPTKWKQVGNVAQIKDIPLEALRNIAERKALDDYDQAHAIIAGRPIPSWDEIRENHKGKIDAAREAYWADPVIKDLQAAKMGEWDMGELLDRVRVTRPEAAHRARLRAVQTFAVVKDGKWHDRGEMGWWGVVHDEKDRGDWDTEFSALLDNLPPETWLAVVDCHI